MGDLNFITAIGTPLNEDDSLHREGLEKHLDDQAANGIGSILAGGTMGLMQMLTDQVWKDLVQHSITSSATRFELLIGAGDTSYARTCQRIEWLNTLKGIDGVVLLAPYFLTLSQAELVKYFKSLADISAHPVYLYDLPGITRVQLEIATVTQLSQHNNIRGIKCSGQLHDTRQLADALDKNFRLIVARPEMIDMSISHGFTDHLDGAYAMYPNWIADMRRSAENGNREGVSAIQRDMNKARSLVIDTGLWGGFIAIMNARGVPGRFAPKPIRMLDEQEKEKLLDDDCIKKMLSLPAHTP